MPIKMLFYRQHKIPIHSKYRILFVCMYMCVFTQLESILKNENVQQWATNFHLKIFET